MSKKSIHSKNIKNEKAKVVLLFDTGREYRRGLLRGISHYVNHHVLWDIHLSCPLEVSEIIKLVKHWNPDGLICEVYPSKDIEKLKLLNIPVIALGIQSVKGENIGHIISNDYRIGEMAAEYYLEKGFKSYAFCGHRFSVLDDEMSFPIERFKGFSSVLKERGFEVPIYKNHFTEGVCQEEKKLYEEELSHIGNWLKGLSRPVAVFAYNDVRAADVVEACRLEGLEVPGQIAVLGVDNDKFRCSLYNPPVSSIAINAERAGYEAAELLERVISGQKVNSNEIIIEPKYVVERQSTNILQVDDPDVRHALRYIREHRNQILRIPDILEQVAVSRRTLQLKFVQTLGHSIRDEIHKCHLQYIAKLLIDTNIPVLEIARSIGYTSEHNISRLFREAMGCTPREYRKKFGPK